MHSVHGVHVFNYKMAQVSLRYCVQQISMSPIKLVYVSLNNMRFKRLASPNAVRSARSGADPTKRCRSSGLGRRFAHLFLGFR
jgi:hypothetical protein